MAFIWRAPALGAGVTGTALAATIALHAVPDTAPVPTTCVELARVAQRCLTPARDQNTPTLIEQCVQGIAAGERWTELSMSCLDAHGDDCVGWVGCIAAEQGRSSPTGAKPHIETLATWGAAAEGGSQHTAAERLRRRASACAYGALKADPSA
jgi:hypothetical protein